MFWKIVELIVKIVFFRRFAQARRISRAVETIGSGAPREGLERLKAIKKLHPSLIPLYGFTRAKLLIASGNAEGGEKILASLVAENPDDGKAHLELAILAGKRFDFPDCRHHLIKAANSDISAITQNSEDFITHLDAIENGEKAAEFRRRAIAMGRTRDMSGHPFFEDNKLYLDRIETWISQNSAISRALIDDLALLLGENAVLNGGTWKPGLFIEDSYVQLNDGERFLPFEKTVALFERCKIPEEDQK